MFCIDRQQALIVITLICSCEMSRQTMQRVLIFCNKHDCTRKQLRRAGALNSRWLLAYVLHLIHRRSHPWMEYAIVGIFIHECCATNAKPFTNLGHLFFKTNPFFRAVDSMFGSSISSIPNPLIPPTSTQSIFVSSCHGESRPPLSKSKS